MACLRAVVVAGVLARAGMASAAGDKSALPIAAHGGTAVTQIEPMAGDADAALTLYVQNTSDQPISVVPTVLWISELDKADAPAVRRMVDARPVVGTPVELTGAAPTAIRIALPALDTPGIYEIQTELVDRDRGHAPVIVKTIVYRRRSWIWAALWIALGALIAFGARLYIDGGAKRLQLRRRIALLLQQIGAVRGHAKGDATMAAARALELDVEDRRRYARWGGSVEDIKCAIDRAELRLALLGDIIDAANQLERLESGRQPAIRKALDDALAAVRVDPGDEAVLKAKRTEVAQLGLIAAWRDQLASDLARLDGQVALRLPGAGAELGAKLRELAGTLAEIHVELTCDRLDAAAALLDVLRPKLLEASAGELAALVTGVLPGVDAAPWALAVADITAALADARDVAKPWPARWTAFQTAQDRYITSAVTGLVVLAKRLAEADHQRAARMIAIASELEAALKDPAAAAALYDARRREIELAAAPVARGVAGPEPAVAPRMWLPIALGGGVAKPDAAAARQVVMLDRAVTWTSVMVNVAILAIAVASGVKALWLDDLAWGAHGASLNAFLWGAGVQVAGNAFAGLAALRSRLGTAAAG
jgi:hypothetical protein